MKKENKDLGSAIMIGVFFVLIALALTSFIILKSQGSKCMLDPINYGANSIAEKVGENVIVTVSSKDRTDSFSTDLDFKNR